MICEIPLFARDGTERARTFVDDEDYEDLLAHARWSALGRQGRLYVSGYVLGSGRGGKRILMHRRILGVTDPSVKVDHRDGNGLNNTRSNLRVGSHGQNMQNREYGFGRSRFRGVWLNCDGKWAAEARINGKKYNLGHYADEIEAATVAENFRLENMEFALPDTQLMEALTCSQSQ